jgi:hypothetical protein
MKSKRSIDRRTFLKNSAALGITAAGALPASLWAKGTAPSPDYALLTLPVQDVEIDDTFWSPLIEVARTVSLPFLLDRQSHQLEYIDPRLVEGAAWFLSQRPDLTLTAQTKPLFVPLAALTRSPIGVWRNVGDGPFFHTGHFFEAAIAWHQATGDPQLLNVAIEVADAATSTVTAMMWSMPTGIICIFIWRREGIARSICPQPRMLPIC